MASPFYNREKELEFLHNKFQSNRPELLIFRGRRRIGKTFLLKEFSGRVGGLYLLATVTSVQDQLQSFSQILSRYFDDPLLAARPLITWDEFFIYLHQHIQKRTAVIFDEFPYLLQAQPGLSSVLQKYWDEYFRDNGKVCMILCGSALSMMEKETMDSKSPLYGRRTGQWFVSAFNPVENNRFFNNTSLIRCIEWYAITGGVPYYSHILSRHPSPLVAIPKEILTYGEALFEEVEFLLRGEFRNPRSYFPILKAIALGSRKFGEISSKTGYERSNLTKYLALLESLKLIKREIPATEKRPEKSKKGLYFLSDYFMNFWFNYVFPNMVEIETLGGDEIMNTLIRPSFDHFLSRVCEKIIHQLLQINFFKLGFSIQRIGNHWDSRTEIDIFAYTLEGNTLVGEIKWTGSPVGESVFRALDEKILSVKSLTRGTIQKMIISKSGFQKNMAQKYPDTIQIDLAKFKL
jgi:AAA+ ATPase superfamily predicted ATPase